MTLSDRLEGEYFGLSVSVEVRADVQVSYALYVRREAQLESTNTPWNIEAQLTKEQLNEVEDAIVSLMDKEAWLDSFETEADVEEVTFDNHNVKLGYEIVDGYWTFFIQVGFVITATISGGPEKLFHPLLKDIGSIKQRSKWLESEAQRIQSSMDMK